MSAQIKIVVVKNLEAAGAHDKKITTSNGTFYITQSKYTEYLNQLISLSIRNNEPIAIEVESDAVLDGYPAQADKVTYYQHSNKVVGEMIVVLQKRPSQIILEKTAPDFAEIDSVLRFSLVEHKIIFLAINPATSKIEKASKTP